MTRRERFFGCVRRTGYDKIPIQHHYGTTEFHRKLYSHLGIEKPQWKVACGDTFHEMPGCKYIGPDFNTPEKLAKYPSGSKVGLWGEVYTPQQYGSGDSAGEYGEATVLPFANTTDVSQLADYPWPTADWFDYAQIHEKCVEAKQRDYIIKYSPFSYDLMNNIGRTRGVTQTMIDIGLRDPVFMLLKEKRVELHHERDRRCLEAARDEIDVVHFCEDLGSQNGPLISPETFEELFVPHYKAGFELAHKHGAMTMMHVCGGVRPLIPRLIDIGLDILDVVQVSAAGMELEGLCRDFGKDIVFAGSMCVQSILANGTPDTVREEVRKRLKLFERGGLILGPSHDIQVHTPVENIIAMYQEAGYLGRNDSARPARK
jgi:uroporphyrinogen decarboxylase